MASNTPPLSCVPICKALLLWVGLSLGAAAQAQLRMPPSGAFGPGITASVGDSDYGTAFKLQYGQPLSSYLGWELQAAALGSEHYRRLGFEYTDSAWAVGGGALAGFGLSNSVSLYGKLGAHYLRVQSPGGLRVDGRSFELGVGGGLHWQLTPGTALRLELENIHGYGGDLLTVGLHFRL